VDGAVYTLFKGPGEEFQSWIRSMRRESQLNADIKEEDLLVTDKVVTLSTCTGDYSTRFILQGRISDVIKRTGIDSGTTAAPIPAG
jgi:sortase B